METLEQHPVNLKNEAFKNGFIMAIVSIVIFLVTNYVMPELQGSTWLSVLTVVIGIALAVFFCLDMRKKAGGFWTFSEALKHIFIMFILSAGIVYIFTILFGKYIDPTYPVRMKAMIMDSTESMLSKFGMDESKMDEALRNQSEKMDKQLNPSFGDAIAGFGIQAIFYAVGALIFAAIFKKTRPVFPRNAE
jgi:FlaA1/EpsC-like NDP-sugar epimerase